MVTGQQPLTPQTLVTKYQGKCPAAFKATKSWHEQADIARAYLDKVAKKMKKWADTKRRHVEYNVGDLVLLKQNAEQHKRLRGVHKGLLWRYKEPFLIFAKVDKVSYRVELPPKLKLHLVFHVICFNPYHGNEEDTKRGESIRAPPVVTTFFDKKAKYIMADHVIRKKHHPPSHEYLVK